MKTNFEIIEGTDYQGDKCYRINYQEYDTLYTIPEPHYTKKAATEKMKELKKENPVTNAAAIMGSAKSGKKTASSRENGKLGGRPKFETKTWKWETNSITAKLSPKGLILENWNCNQGAVSGRKILLIGATSIPTDSDIQLFSEILKGAGDEYYINKYNIQMMRKGAKVQ